MGRNFLARSSRLGSLAERTGIALLSACGLPRDGSHWVEVRLGQVSWPTQLSQSTQGSHGTSWGPDGRTGVVTGLAADHVLRLGFGDAGGELGGDLEAVEVEARPSARRCGRSRGQRGSA
jgi:hypothetical protein